MNPIFVQIHDSVDHSKFFAVVIIIEGEVHVILIKVFLIDKIFYLSNRFFQKGIYFVFQEGIHLLFDLMKDTVVKRLNFLETSSE